MLVVELLLPTFALVLGATKGKVDKHLLVEVTADVIFAITSISPIQEWYGFQSITQVGEISPSHRSEEVRLE
jgi:hypothetical protein